MLYLLFMATFAAAQNKCFDISLPVSKPSFLIVGETADTGLMGAVYPKNIEPLVGSFFRSASDSCGSLTEVENAPAGSEEEHLLGLNAARNQVFNFRHQGKIYSVKLDNITDWPRSSDGVSCNGNPENKQYFRYVEIGEPVNQQIAIHEEAVTCNGYQTGHGHYIYKDGACSDFSNSFHKREREGISIPKVSPASSVSVVSDIRNAAIRQSLYDKDIKRVANKKSCLNKILSMLKNNLFCINDRVPAVSNCSERSPLNEMFVNSGVEGSVSENMGSNRFGLHRCEPKLAIDTTRVLAEIQEIEQGLDQIDSQFKRTSEIVNACRPYRRSMDAQNKNKFDQLSRQVTEQSSSFSSTEPPAKINPRSGIVN